MSYNEEFEPFKKVQEINSGGQGTILEAFFSEDDSKKYIIKKCKSNSKKAIERFQREISALLKLKDVKGVIDIIKYNQEKNWYAMPSLKESDLLFKSEFPLKNKILSLINLGQIIKKIHEKGFVYRDIKPGNILLNDNNEIVLANFGLVWEENFKPITLKNERIGPYSFMAPEMSCYVNSNVKPKSADIFSFTQVAYCMFYNKRYGLGTTIFRKDLIDNENIVAEEMEPFYQFLEKGTHIDPENRLKIDECLFLLKEFLKILNKDAETIKKWKIKKIENEVTTKYLPDIKVYSELIKIFSIVKSLSKNYYLFIYKNEAVGVIQDVDIFDDGIKILYKTANKENTLLCFPKKLEIKDNNNTLQYSLKLKKIDNIENRYYGYVEYYEGTFMDMFQGNQKFLLNKDITIYFDSNEKL